MKSAADISIRHLIDAGWKEDHTALVSQYRTAGTISTMRSHDGYDYCRVHHGRVKSKGRYQVTTVMRRSVDAA